MTIPSPFPEVNQVIEEATEAMKLAYSKLIADGILPQQAEQIVETNFQRVNQNQNLVLNISELCKPID